MIRGREIADTQGADERRDLMDSWKAIAQYFGRDVRTVQRWEKTENLPVHRHIHEKNGSVYAFKSELENWRKSRSIIPARETARASTSNVASRPAEAQTAEQQSIFTQRTTWTWFDENVHIILHARIAL
jgi:hypothetical protein